MTKIEAIELLEKSKTEITAIAKDIPTTGEYANSLITAIELVDALDMAIEALQQEPIIRCEDCKYAKPFLHRYHCKQLDEDWEINFGAEHYCSFAERLESDKE